jgi:putative ABC transport system substrate-binding protein
MRYPCIAIPALTFEGQMRRREFITLLGGAAAAWPLAARAQPAMPVIGLLNGQSAADYARYVAAFLLGLQQFGFVEGQNVRIDYRWAERRYDLLSSFAAELVRAKVSAIFAAGTTQAVLAAKAATTTIPIVFSVAGDPVQAGLVASLNRPGGNLTGVTVLGIELGPKVLETLHELVPQAGIVAALVNPTNPNVQAQTSNLQRAAASLGLQFQVLRASSEGDIESAFASLHELRAGALMIDADPFFNSAAERLAALAARDAVPAIYLYREFPAAGGLASYGTSLADAYRLAGAYTARILKGERPADLPVQQATKVELTINLKTAKALGLSVPLTLLGRADEVIE